MTENFLLAMGCFLILGGAAMVATKIRQMVACTLDVPAKVTHVDKQRLRYKGQDIIRYIPTYTFVVGDKTYTHKGAPVKQKKVEGKVTTLRVNPKNPKEVRNPATLGASSMAFILIVMGILCVIMSFFQPAA